MFRDYSRLGVRKVEFEKIKNPFTVSKYAISHYDKTWYLKEEKELIGPLNAYEMDGYFKKG